MTKIQAICPTVSGGWLPRFTAFLVSGVVYLTFLFTILYAVGFVSGLVVAKSIDTGAETGMVEATFVNVALMSLLVFQHSGMARKPFKHRWTRFIPSSVDASAGVFAASLTLLLLFWQWRPMADIIWHVEEPELAMLIATLSFIGWVVVFTSTPLILSKSFELRRAADILAAPEMPGAISQTPSPHRFIGHPIYLGVMLACWATPTMSAGHLLFAGVVTAYLVVAVMPGKCNLVGISGGGRRASRLDAVPAAQT